VWEFDFVDSTQKMKPIGVDYFKMPTQALISRIDTNKINSLLLQSFNKFRADYGKPPVFEDPIMTKQCKSYALKLHDNYEHDKSLTKNQSENIGSINYILLGNIDIEKQDINLIISECVFDLFVSSEGHMRLLLSDEFKNYGFGISQNKSGFKICIRGRK
jgi:uncharacterized protein YkwD